MTRRIEQVNSFIQEELNKIFVEELELPPATLVTITKVVTSKDLGFAKVYLSILPFTKKDSIISKLKKQSGYLRHLLSKQFHGYHTPRLEFIFDDAMLKYRLVEREIEQWHQEEE